MARLVTRPEELSRGEIGWDTQKRVYVGLGNRQYIQIAGSATTSTSNTTSTTTGGGAGDMTKAVYDADNDGVVDNSELLGGYAASAFMLKATYDADADGLVDDAENAIYAQDAGDSDTVDGFHASDFSLTGHTHDEFDDITNLDAILVSDSGDVLTSDTGYVLVEG